MRKIKLGLISSIMTIWALWAFAAVEYIPSPVTTVERHILDSLNVDQHIRVIGFITADSVKARILIGDSLAIATWITTDSLWARIIAGDSLRINHWISVDSLWSRMIRGDSLRVTTWIDADSLHVRTSHVDSVAYADSVKTNDLSVTTNASIGGHLDVIGYINADSLHARAAGIDSTAWVTFLVGIKVNADSIDSYLNSNITFKKDLIAYLNNTLNIGSSSKRWAIGFFDSLNARSGMFTDIHLDSLKNNTGTGVIVLHPLFLTNTYMQADSVYARTAKFLRVNSDSLFASSDPNTGIRFPGSDIIVFITGGTAKDSLDASGNIILDALSGSANSPIIRLAGRNSNTRQSATLQVAYGGDPYLRMSVPNNSGIETPLLDFHDTVIAAVTDNTVDIGTSGDNRPKNLYLASALTANRANVDTLDKKSDTKINVNDDLVPLGTTKTLDLGTEINSWRSIFGQGAHIDSAIISVLATVPKISGDSATFKSVAIDTARGRQDLDTYIVFPGSDSTKFVQGGTTAMTIDPNSNVGIGTTAPYTKLHVVGSGSTPTFDAGNYQFIVQSSALPGSQSRWGLVAGTSGYGMLTFGTESDEVAGGGIAANMATGDLIINTAANNGDISLDPHGTGDVIISSGNLGIGTITSIARTTIKGRAAAGDTVLALQDSSGADLIQVLGNGDLNMLTSTLDASPVMAGSNAFETTAETDTVTVTGALATDLYFITLTGTAAPAAADLCSVEARAGDFVVHRSAAGTSGLTYNWLRMKP